MIISHSLCKFDINSYSKIAYNLIFAPKYLVKSSGHEPTLFFLFLNNL